MTKVTFEDQENGKINVLADGIFQGYFEKDPETGTWVFWFNWIDGLTSVDYETDWEDSKQEITADLEII